MKNLEILFEKYKFDYIYINPKDIKVLKFEFIPEEILVDCDAPVNYVGTIKMNNAYIEVYWSKKIDQGDVIFKYNDIRKERSIKMSRLT